MGGHSRGVSTSCMICSTSAKRGRSLPISGYACGHVFVFFAPREPSRPHQHAHHPPTNSYRSQCEYSSRLRWHLPPFTTPRSRGYSGPMASPSRASAPVPSHPALSPLLCGRTRDMADSHALLVPACSGGCIFDFDTLIWTFRYPGLAPPLGFSFTVYLLRAQ